VVLISELIAGGEFKFLTIVQAVTSADVEALEVILETFNTL
jgi:hypothetical protein